MKPLICPQCGGKITDYNPLSSFAVCDYCETRFVIETAKPSSAEPIYVSPTTIDFNPKIITGLVVGALVLIGGAFSSRF